MNRYLTYQEGELLFEDTPLSEIAQEMYTPFYVYSKAAILERVEALKQAFSEIKPMIAFNMKALDTTLILKILKERGCSLAVENINEIEKALKAGFQPTSLILNSNGLPEHEVRAILKQKPLIISVSSMFELEPLNELATELDVGVRIGIRVNLGIDVGGFPGTNIGAKDSRVGIPKKDVDQAVAMISKLPQLNLVGLACHLGSQIVQLAPWIRLSEEMAGLFKEVSGQGFNLEYLDLGGGFPVDYGKGDYLEIKKIARNIVPHVKDLDCRVVLEPGRYITAEAGVLVTTVQGVKEVGSKKYVICDAGFAEFPRCAVYRLDHEVVPLTEPFQAPAAGAFAAGGEDEPVGVAVNPDMGDPGELGDRTTVPTEFLATPEAAGERPEPHTPGEPITADIVGPGSEGLDYLAREATIRQPKRGDLLAVLNVGAYGRTMSSNYSSRLRPPEILIERDKFEIIRGRETVDDLLACDFEESEIEA
jgi:diaminopimelate decarboxylase